MLAEVINHIASNSRIGCKYGKRKGFIEVCLEQNKESSNPEAKAYFLTYNDCLWGFPILEKVTPIIQAAIDYYIQNEPRCSYGIAQEKTTYNEMPDQNGKQTQQYQKKPSIMKWIIMGAIVIVAICIIAWFSNEGDESKLSHPIDSGSTSYDNNNVQNKTSNTLNPIDIYTALQENEAFPYALTKKAEDFLTQHPNLFPCGGEIDTSLIDDKLDYRQILKNPNKYGDKLFSVSEGIVVEIFEESIGDEEYLTTINVSDGALQYIVFYYGELSDVFEDSIVSIVGLPMGTSQFDNLDGGKTRVVCLAGCQVVLVFADDKKEYAQKSTVEPTTEVNSPSDDLITGDSIYGSYSCVSDDSESIIKVLPFDLKNGIWNITNLFFSQQVRMESEITPQEYTRGYQIVDNRYSFMSDYDLVIAQSNPDSGEYDLYYFCFWNNHGKINFDLYYEYFDGLAIIDTYQKQ